MRNVEAELVREGLEEALDVVRQAQEAPAVLFGAPREHAGELTTGGSPRDGSARRPGLRSVARGPVDGAGLGIRHVPGLRGDAGAEGRLATHLDPRHGRHPGRPRPGSHGRCRRVGRLAQAQGHGERHRWGPGDRGVGAGAAGAVNEWSKAHPFGTHSVWLYVPIAAGCAVLAIGWRRWVGTPRPAGAPGSRRCGPVVAASWPRSCESATRCRIRGCATILFEAHAHAAESGRSLEEEFGEPEEYAARFGARHGAPRAG